MAYLRCTGTPGGSLKLRTAQGEIASFETNIVDLLQEVKCGINPIQNGTPWIDSNEVNKVPYIKRAVAGTATRIGNHLYDKLVGGTVAFNQLLQNGNFATINGWSFNSGTGAVANNKLTFTITEAVASNSIYHSLETKVIQGHKYFVSAVVTPSKDAIIQSRVGNAVAPTISISANTRTNIKNIIVGDDSETTMFMIYCNRQILMATGDTCVYENVFCIDLTQMFGSTIADYIYGLEQATAGAGVAFFRNLFPNDYYAYNAGELMSVKATAHVMKNASNTVIGNYALDSNLVLNGLFKLDANNKLYADGDTYESSGLATRKYKPYTITSGTQIISQTDLTTVTRYTFITDNEEPVISGGGVICVGLVKDNNYSGDYPHIYIDNTAQNKGRVYVFLPIGQAIGTINLVYELATPTTEQATPFTNPQVCDENGTEEYTDSRAVAIPVGHETYQANICPISGFTEANITRSGVNLWNGEIRNGYYNSSTGSFVSNGNMIANVTPIKVIPNSTIYIASGTYNIGVTEYDANMSFIRQSAGKKNETLTLSATTTYINFSNTWNAGSTYNNDISINYPATDTTYHPYNGQTYTIAFGQTVYGGVPDVTRGKLHVTHGGVDLSDTSKFNFTYDNISKRWQSPFSDIKVFAQRSADVLAEQWQADTTATAGSENKFFTVGGALYFYTSDNVNKPAGNLVYPLKTPFDIDLTPEVISAVVGTNNVFADCGETEVKYLYLE